VSKLPQTSFATLSEQDLLKVFSAKQLSPKTEVGRRNRALIAFMLDTGVRLSEVANITLADIDIKEGMAKVVGKGRKD
jgi:integrase/recombinase XerD